MTWGDGLGKGDLRRLEGDVTQDTMPKTSGRTLSPHGRQLSVLGDEPPCVPVSLEKAPTALHRYRFLLGSLCDFAFCLLGIPMNGWTIVLCRTLTLLSVFMYDVLKH
jgi:hypothetical protein